MLRHNWPDILRIYLNLIMLFLVSGPDCVLRHTFLEYLRANQTPKDRWWEPRYSPNRNHSLLMRTVVRNTSY